jgi:hypothetical protein
MIKELFYLIVILLGIPTGLILKRLCSDEIKNWKSRIKTGILAVIILILFLLFADFEYRVPIIVSLSFFIVSNIVILSDKI